MSFLKSLVLVSSIALLSGCGGGGSDSGSSNPPTTPTPPPRESSIIKSSDPARHINLSNDEIVIVGGGALKTKIYDSAGKAIFTIVNKPASTLLSAGKYTVKAEESTMIYDDGQGVIFYLSSNIYLPKLPLDTRITLPKRAAEIFEFNVSEKGIYLISTSRAYAQVYDSSLKRVTIDDDIVELQPGKYFFVFDTNTFIKNGNITVSPM